MALKVKKLDPTATLPTVAHPGEDLGYDLYALEDVQLNPGRMTPIRTGVAVEYVGGLKMGFLVRDRSSMASQGVAVFGGAIDAGYRGEVKVIMFRMGGSIFDIHKGDKIAQLVPIPVYAYGGVVEADDLSNSGREDKGFGSSGK